MKYAVCVIASVFVLSACNKSPQVDLHNASVNEVAQAVRQSGMSNGSLVEPGLWQSNVTIREINIPGIPAQFADRMKQTMAENRQQVSRHCLTPGQATKPKEDFFGAEDKSCHYAQFTMGSGKIDIQMVCSEQGSTQTTAMNGTYTPTSYSVDMSTSAKGGERSGMSMKMHVDSHRIGECSGGES
jgi:uncharacterized protein DUF3617